MKRPADLTTVLILFFLFLQLLLSTAILLRMNALDKDMIATLATLATEKGTTQPENGIIVENVSEDNDPWLGTPDASVTIIEFADFECSYCAQAASTLEQVMKEYEGQVRLVFRDFPLEQLHPRAFAADMAAECADGQGKFWEMHDLLFKHQHALSDEDLLNYGRELGLNEFDFGSCLNSKEIADEIRADQAQGAGYGVYGTPTFFINGHMLTGNQPLSIWEDHIEAALP